ncbi:MAG: S-methyl-5-thioribose-1-phosphate isomerase [Methylotenera sp.]|nr:S-methyl-5-thioribose-1-phosphate isomerase [Methylotenera sp.]MSP99993.1 S-methyl-5-thioribose-1-phosphate isomerase [Methylotenera sp.]
MLVKFQQYRTIWPNSLPGNGLATVSIIDQTKLPHIFEIARIESLQQMIVAIKTMQVRGAPLIGAAAAYGLALAMQEEASDQHLQAAAAQLIQSRPTAVNLNWAVQRMLNRLSPLTGLNRIQAAWTEAARICDEDVLLNQAIGQHGLSLIEKAYQQPDQKKQFNILTHCNAGWLATVDFGTALAPIYAAHNAGINVHVWVDETRPRNQGASLTSWELAQHGVAHTIISDNAGGHLMQQGLVDMVIVGADRVSSAGDVCNKIGTYLKALAAFDNQVPFYAAVPSPTIDWVIVDGLTEIEIEQRHGDEVAYMQGLAADGSVQKVRVIPIESKTINPAFDVTPARLVTGIITEQGVFAPHQLAFSRHD